MRRLLENDYQTGRQTAFEVAANRSRTPGYYVTHLPLCARGMGTELTADGNRPFLGVLPALHSLHAARGMKCKKLQAQVV